MSTPISYLIVNGPPWKHTEGKSEYTEQVIFGNVTTMVNKGHEF